MQRVSIELNKHYSEAQKLYKTNALNKQSGISRTPSPKVG